MGCIVGQNGRRLGGGWQGGGAGDRGDLPHSAILFALNNALPLITIVFILHKRSQ